MRLLRSIHAWAGLVLALVVAAVAASGVLLVFKTDYLRLTLPEARETARLDPASLGRAATVAERLFPGNVRSIVFADERLALHKVHLNDGGGAYLGSGDQLVDRWPRRGRPEEWLFDVHQKLLLGDAGHTIAGVVGLAASVMVLTGLYLWWPGRRGFRGRVWPRSGQRLHLLAQHRDLGALAGLPILLLTLTGSAMVFPDAASTALDVLLPSRASAESRTAPAPARVEATGENLGWTGTLALAQAAYPSARIRVLSWAGPEGTAQVRLRQPEEWHPNGRTRVTIDRHTGAVVDRSDALAEPLPVRTYNSLYPLHAGSIGGRVYDLVVLLAGISLCVLALVGGATFLAHERKRRS